MRKHWTQQIPKVFPERCFDVRIAEQHVVTFVAGLAAQGFKHFIVMNSSFLQRVYDQFSKITNALNFMHMKIYQMWIFMSDYVKYAVIAYEIKIDNVNI